MSTNLFPTRQKERAEDGWHPEFVTEDLGYNIIKYLKKGNVEYDINIDMTGAGMLATQRTNTLTFAIDEFIQEKSVKEPNFVFEEQKDLGLRMVTEAACKFIQQRYGQHSPKIVIV